MWKTPDRQRNMESRRGLIRDAKRDGEKKRELCSRSLPVQSSTIRREHEKQTGTVPVGQ